MKKKYLLLALLAMGTLTNVQAQRKRVSPYAPKLEQLYNQSDEAQSPVVSNKPLIGISLGWSGTKNSVNNTYVNSVLMNGGVPYLIPVTDNVEVLRQIVSELDGIIFTGGEDFAPAVFCHLINGASFPINSRNQKASPSGFHIIRFPESEHPAPPPHGWRKWVPQKNR